MLSLRDFVHLPQLDPYFAEIASSGPGLIVVAGIDARQVTEKWAPVSFHPSGRMMIFNILISEIMEKRVTVRATLIAQEKFSYKPPKHLKRRFDLHEVSGNLPYSSLIQEAVRKRPGLLVIDRLTPETLPLAAEAAAQGLRVVSQLDTILCGSEVMRQMSDLGLKKEQLQVVKWIFAVHRVEKLCEQCKRPDDLQHKRFENINNRYSFLSKIVEEIETGKVEIFQPGTCSHCGGSGRYGSISAFDVLRCDENSEKHYEQISQLPVQEYLLRLAGRGYIPLEDLERFEIDNLRRAFNMLSISEAALAEKTSSLQGKLAELEAANRVLVQRTEAIVSLQDVGNALITSTNLEEFSSRVCRRAAEICGGDRAVLYYLPSLDGKEQKAEILALTGWDSAGLRTHIPGEQVTRIAMGKRIIPYNQQPPGVSIKETKERSDEASAKQLSGVAVPLLAEGRLVGLMTIQSTEKKVFAPSANAMLQTFANQAALAIQREGLIEELRAKVSALEAAQGELVKKERLERELELARQVQQSVLPKTFPDIPGYRFAAKNEPARQVGGDFYDVIVLDKENFGILIGDVSDKGMPAALYMAITRSLIQAEAHRSLSPSEVLMNVNRLLLESGDQGGFVSVFYGVVNTASGSLRYARAGHDRPIIIRDEKMDFLKGEGSVLGILEGEEIHLSEEEFLLVHGDRLVFYTDGLTDVMNDGESFFGLERLSPLILSTSRLDAEAFCQEVFRSLGNFQGSAEQFDDMTLVVLDIN